MKSTKAILYLFILVYFVSCNKVPKPSLNIEIVKFIKSGNYKTYDETDNLPKFIKHDIFGDSDSFSILKKVEIKKTGSKKSNYIRSLNPTYDRFLHIVLESENICLVSYRVLDGCFYSQDYVDFYIYKNPKFHLRFKVDHGMVVTKDNLINFFLSLPSHF